MDVAEIHFNHNPRSMSSDAMTIRSNYTSGRIIAPEWRLGSPSLPIAYASARLGPTATIKAQFAGGPPNGTARIKAVDADFFPELTGCLGLLLYFFIAILRAFTRNILGAVGETVIEFDATGRSPLMELTLVNHRLKTSPVGIRTTTWSWQVYEDRKWTEFAKTQHRIYVVLDAPRAPWTQQIDPVVDGTAALRMSETPLLDNTQLPWAEALEVACTWAIGAATKDEVASAITRAVNSKTQAVYNTLTIFGTEYFHLSRYLSLLHAGNSFSMNCTDCANAVATLSNLVGCDLWEQYFSTPFEDTKPFLTLSGNPLVQSDWVTFSWSYHEFGWVGPASNSGFVYDGCLQVDIDDNPNDQVRVPKHPLRMAFPEYTPRLWEGAGSLGTQRRRSVR